MLFRSFARELSLKSNARSSKIENLKDLKQFAKECLFPSHGLILRQDEGIHEGIKKGIIEEELLFDYAQFLIEKNGYCFAETDMRAMYNPTRMEVIKRATEKLVSKIKRRCEKCLTPGFDIESVKIGLPCRVCGFKTRVVRAHTYSCKKCGHKQIEEFPNGMTEDPMFCDVCNP